LYKSGEGCIEVGFGTRVHDEKILSDLAGSTPYVAQLDLDIQIRRIDQHANQFGLGHDRSQKLKPLCAECADEKEHAREVCAGVVERRDEAVLDWIDAT
jgi:hypothetical protein